MVPSVGGDAACRRPGSDFSRSPRLRRAALVLRATRPRRRTATRWRHGCGASTSPWRRSSPPCSWSPWSRSTATPTPGRSTLLAVVLVVAAGAGAAPAGPDGGAGRHYIGAGAVRPARVPGSPSRHGDRRHLRGDGGTGLGEGLGSRRGVDGGALRHRLPRLDDALPRAVRQLGRGCGPGRRPVLSRGPSGPLRRNGPGTWPRPGGGRPALVAEERVRIARDHDSVAHTLASISVQAGSAPTCSTNGPRTPATSCSPSGTPAAAALAELRATLGTFARTTRHREPAPGSTGCPRSSRAHGPPGLAVDLVVEGEAAAAAGRGPAAPDRAGVPHQRHPPRRAPAAVAVRHGDDRLEIEVTDDGRGGRRRPSAKRRRRPRPGRDAGAGRARR